jgi:hypothetical protein
MQYLVSLAIPPVLLLLAGRHWGLRVVIASVVLTYVAAVAPAHCMSAWYQHQAEAYDLDRDGIIPPAEQSPAQSEAFELMINDSGRNMSVLFAAPWSVLLNGAFFGLAAALRWLLQRYRQRLGSASVGAAHCRPVSGEGDA